MVREKRMREGNEHVKQRHNDKKEPTVCGGNLGQLLQLEGEA